MLIPLLIALAAAPAPAKSRPYTVNDQVNLRRLLSFVISPDGTKAVLTVRATDYDNNKGKIDLWLVNTDGTGLHALTSHPAVDSDAVFAPDGKSVYFLSGRGDTTQVFNLSLEGGEPVQVTKSPVDVNAFYVSNDGTKLVFSADVFPECDGDALACTDKRLAELAKKKSTGKIYEHLMFRHWDSWFDGRFSHLFVQPASGGAAKDLMPKMQADSPVKPFGGSEQFTFSPDGKTVVFTARDVGREEAWSTDLDLFSVPSDGSAAPKKLTTTNRATDTNPLFSPDGKTLAYEAMGKPGYESDKLTIVLRNLADGKERRLTEAWDHSPDSMQWMPDGKSLLVSAADTGQVSLFQIDVATAKVTMLASPGHLMLTGTGPKGQIFYQADSLHGPAELYALVDGKSKQLTHLNEEAMKGVKLGEPEQFSFAGWNGDKVYAWLVKPVDFDAKKKYPIAFLIHGGPQGSFGNEWHYRWNPQVYAAHGYAAVMVDFHGSTGYGQAFTDSIRGDWGGKPMEDLQKGLAAALEKYPWLDKNRACALGASYGGYMINWIAGVWNEPWKCLVAHDGNLDEAFAYYATEELWFPEWEHGGTPWEQHMGYAKHNPVDHVDKWKVPMLVVHGGKDYRISDAEGMATFTALQRRGIPSKLLYFPDENHWVQKPQNSVLWHETVLDWLDQWTGAKKK